MHIERSAFAFLRSSIVMRIQTPQEISHFELMEEKRVSRELGKNQFINHMELIIGKQLSCELSYRGVINH